MTVERGGEKAVIVGASIGAGRVRVNEIDGFPVDVSGNFHTMILVAEDRPGSIARICGVLAEDAVNIATMRVSRKQRGGDAFMVNECDDPIEDDAVSHIRALDWVRFVRSLDKVAA